MLLHLGRRLSGMMAFNARDRPRPIDAVFPTVVAYVIESCLSKLRILSKNDNLGDLLGRLSMGNDSRDVVTLEDDDTSDKCDDKPVRNCAFHNSPQEKVRFSRCYRAEGLIECDGDHLLIGKLHRIHVLEKHALSSDHAFSIFLRIKDVERRRYHCGKKCSFFAREIGG